MACLHPPQKLSRAPAAAVSEPQPTRQRVWLAPAGYRAVESVCTVYDLHATVLHLLGLDHVRLSYYHNGIERRLTDVHGKIIRDILA
jgi:hypothetical protein